MPISDILSAIDGEIERLSQVRNLLATPNHTPTQGKRTMSAAARARIGEATRRRWVAAKKNGLSVPKKS